MENSESSHSRSALRICGLAALAFGALALWTTSAYRAEWRGSVETTGEVIANDRRPPEAGRPHLTIRYVDPRTGSTGLGSLPDANGQHRVGEQLKLVIHRNGTLAYPGVPFLAGLAWAGFVTSLLYFFKALRISRAS